MKFGLNLHHYQIVEWTSFYLDYKRMKKLYKLAVNTAIRHGESPDFAEFATALDGNLTQVESFYRTRQTELQRRLDALCNHYGLTDITALDHVTASELEELTAAFIELRAAFKKLNWYKLVNLDKIIGKLEQMRGGIKIPEDFNITSEECLQALRYINDGLSRLKNKATSAHRSSRTPVVLMQGCQRSFLSALLLNDVVSAIAQDNASVLGRIVEQSYKDVKDVDDQYRLTNALIHLSTMNGSRLCVERLLPYVSYMHDFGVHLHWLVVKIGRRKKVIQEHEDAKATSGIIAQVVHIIRWLGPKLRPVFLKIDSFGRLPLHYAVQYGLFEVCREMLKHMKGGETAHSLIASNLVLLPDSQGLSALKLSILAGDAAITNLLIEYYHSNAEGEEDTESLHGGLLPGDLLTFALRLDSCAVAQAVYKSTTDLHHKDQNDETAVYLAVRSGRLEYLNMLIGPPEKDNKINLDSAEASNGWTPLILACIRGDYPFMELLLRTGADPGAEDLFGWTAKDHAAFRGYLPMAKTLKALDNQNGRRSPLDGGPHPKKQRLDSLISSLGHTEPSNKSTPSGYSQVFVNLGALDAYKPVTAVDMSPYVAPDPYDPQREADFQVEICAIGDGQSSHVLQLPILEDMANKPWRFLTGNGKDFKLAFNVWHANTPAHKSTIIGRAVALLGSLKQGLGSERESLIRNFTIPVLASDSLDFIGTVTFYFLVVTPSPPQPPLTTVQQEWDAASYDRPTIIGHRGIGQNDPGRRQLQIGENTVESFLSAMELGASYIEFGNRRQRHPWILKLTQEDVQLTKDSVPVIYHDFLMSETGTDAPLHNLTLEQFMYISEAQATLDDLPSMAEKRYLERCGDHPNAGYRQRSRSLNRYEQYRSKSLVERMKHTFEFKLNESRGFDSYKGNIRSEYIQASFMTLEQLFIKLPESVRFDVEIKYPMLFEAHDWGMETYAVEANHLVDTILEKVYRLAGNRTIFFSSFSPEICILLSNKQHMYPVFFLTESGHIPSADARADSLQAAIHFAKSWRLPGVISRSEPLVISPHLVKYVKDSGLQCISWGGLNDDPENAKTQADAGLDAIIVNSVNLISQSLRQS